MASARPSPGVVDACEDLRHGHHLFLAAGHLGISLLKAGFEMGVPLPGQRVSHESQKEHALRLGMLPLAVPGSTEAPGEPGLGPAGGTVDRAPEARRIREGLRSRISCPKRAGQSWVSKHATFESVHNLIMSNSLRAQYIGLPLACRRSLARARWYQPVA